MYNVMTVFGIRPDFIRSSIILKKLKAHPDVNLQFVYTGQHYDENLKDIFFSELNIPVPQYNLDTKAGSHPQQHAKLISQLEPIIKKAKPDVVMFLGDANAVIGCIAPLKMGVPIAHVEAGMRSHDWDMPEERNRVIIDRVSDVLYAYQNDYKCKLVQEGVDPTKIVVTGNTIVDVIDEYRHEIFDRTSKILDKLGLKRKEYGIMTLHRDSHMNNPKKTARILMAVDAWSVVHEAVPIILPVMPRLRQLLKHPDMLDICDRSNGKVSFESIKMIEPLGFIDFISLERSALIEFTDSGTNQETSALLGTPCVVLRRSTERPETFDSGITTMTDDENKVEGAANYVVRQWREQKYNKRFSLGEGVAARIIVEDLVDRLRHNFYKQSPKVDTFKAKNWEQWTSQ